MKKIYTVPLGILCFISTVLILVACIISGIFTLAYTAGIVLLLFAVIYSLLLILYIKWHFLNYIKVSSEKVVHKDKAYSWDEVCITLDYGIDHTKRGGCYRIYFSKNFIIIEEEAKNAYREGFYIDLTKERAELIFKYYKKKVYILKEETKLKGIYKMIVEHNQMYD